MKDNDIKQKLIRFKVFWNESLNGDYRNALELGNLARQIRDAKCNDEFMLSSLNEEELNLYRYAITLANAR